MQWLKQFTRSSAGCVGIELNADSLRIAVRSADGSTIEQTAVLQAETSSPSASDWLALIEPFIQKHRLQNRLCNVVLSPADYQLMLVEAPDVPDEEMREAVKWRIKDLINTPVEAAAIDIFALPEDASKAGKKMLYVVISELARIHEVISLVGDSGLQLNAIDIEVLALRNLLQLKSLERGAAIVRLKESGGDVSIYRDGNLYLSRHFHLDYAGGLLDDLPADALALEVQRSFDYFERQMGQVPPGMLFICGEGVGPEKITDELKRSLSVPVEFLDLSHEANIDLSVMDEGMVQLCLGAIGAAYRQEAA